MTAIGTRRRLFPIEDMHHMFRYLCRVDRFKGVVVRVITVFLLVPLLLWLVARPPLIKLPSRTSNYFKVAYGTLYYFASWRESYTKEDAYQHCEYKNCIPTRDVTDADAVVFHNWDINMPFSDTRSGRNRAKQVWIYYGLEPLARTNWFPAALNGLFNWTMTYMSTSDIPLKYHVYEKVQNVSSRKCDLTPVLNKPRTALMVASHCHTVSRREELVEELRKDIDVDVFGKCGEPCPNNCDFGLFEKKYKFYFAFENSKCLEYVTEKVWMNALAVGLVPVVLGGKTRKDYEMLLPPDSFIYADDFSSPKLLAGHLRTVGSDPKLYNNYLKWRKVFRLSNSQENTDLCSICRGLNNKTLMSKPRVVRNLEKFWNVTQDCHGAGPGAHKTRWATLKGYLLYLFGVL
ncbi:3-galactosyl-N-acetylglucosaminide 4-alpha-L-fucosyltransferase FUT3-like [Lineus longissimus]|uniref:3-galactosyl-N-acetylglucosaminide 4-alpha-L-fucosyltransferase FUT3-like n=1 Tax=Lineus longissimus TaxID=88925 RepID=UPI00315D051E